MYSVSDTGIGIKKENIPYLFTAFRRVDEEKNRHIEGTGLGLSIVKQFVDLMEGEITVNSVYTKGSTFIIEIPQKIVSDSASARSNMDSESPRQRKRHSAQALRHRMQGPCRGRQCVKPAGSAEAAARYQGADRDRIQRCRSVEEDTEQALSRDLYGSPDAGNGRDRMLSRDPCRRSADTAGNQRSWR